MELLDVEKNKYNENLFPYLDLVSNSDMGTIYIKTKPDTRAKNVCSLFFKLYEYPSSETNIYIQDIQSHGTLNRGFATAAMRALIKLGIKKGATIISGIISPVDHDHIDRLLGFYKKANCKFHFSDGASYPSGFSIPLTDKELIFLKLEQQAYKDKVYFLEKELENKKIYLNHIKKIAMEYETEIKNESRLIKFLKKLL